MSGPVGVAWLSEGLIGTESWTDAHERGRQAVIRRFGDRIDAHFIEGVDICAETDRLIQELVRRGTRLVFAVSAAFEPTMRRAAERFPDVGFAQARGRSTASNLASYTGADEEPLYLAGVAAGSETQHIGFVATVREPETLRHINAFTLGAQRVRPDVEVKVRWMGAWWHPELERELAEQLADEGAGVLVSGSIGTAVGEVANRHDLAWVGHGADRAAEFPEVWVGGAVTSWTRYYVQQVESLLAGKWEATAYYGSMADSYTDISGLGVRVPASVRADVTELAERARQGRLDVFAGPIRDEAGRERVGPGASLPLADRLAIDWVGFGVVEDGHPAVEH